MAAEAGKVRHTVEKIGGTSMSRFGDLIGSVFGADGPRGEAGVVNRIYVVSAYGGVTNLLLEHKKTGTDGVYQLFRRQDPAWEAALDAVLAEMRGINRGFAAIGLPVEAADREITDRVHGIRNCLNDLRRLCSYGHFELADHLQAVRELLSSVGEYHSAWNSVEILRGRGLPAVLADLTGWRSNETLPLEEKIRSVFAPLDPARSVVIATGYAKCREGLMRTFDRGYSEITFSRIATVTGAREGVIHKEFHLSSADPALVGLERVRVIGEMNFDMADQLADLGMEAIHPKAGKGMELQGIPIRVKNAFESGHPGTLITGAYVPAGPKVVMICGRSDLTAVEVCDPEMVGQFGYDHQIIRYLTRHEISYIAKNTNANTITHYLAEKDTKLEAFYADLQQGLPRARFRRVPVAIVSVIGSRLTEGGFVGTAAQALTAAKVPVLAVNMCMRQINLQFVVPRDSYPEATRVLHAALVEV